MAGAEKSKGTGRSEAARAARLAEEARRLASDAHTVGTPTTRSAKQAEAAARVEGRIEPMPILEIGPKKGPTPEKSAERFGESPLAVRSSQSERALTDRIKASIREEVVEQSREQAFVPSGQITNRSIFIRIDTQTGELVRSTSAAPNRAIANIRVEVDFQGRIHLPELSSQERQEMLALSKEPGGQGALMLALLELDGQRAIQPQSAYPPLPEKSGGGSQVMPQVSAEDLQAARTTLKRGAQIRQRFMGSGIMQYELGSDRMRLGLVRLDAEGRVESTVFQEARSSNVIGQPGAMGIGGGQEVRVIMDVDGHLYAFESAGLNAKQMAVMEGLQNDPANQAAVKKQLQANPYLIDITLDGGMGGVLSGINTNLPSSGGLLRQAQLVLIQNENGQYRFVKHNPSQPHPNSLAIVDFQLRVRSDIAEDGPAGQLTYEIVEGALPDGVPEAIHFLARRAETPFMELVK